MIDFFLDNRGLDYSRTEIAEGSEISRSTLYKILPILLKSKIMVKSRKINNTELYRLNCNNAVVKQFEGMGKAMIEEATKERAVA